MSPCSNGTHWRDKIPCSNGSNRQGMNLYSNRWGILRIKSRTNGNLENIPKKIYHDNSPKNNDCVYGLVHVNGCVKYYSPMIRNTKP